MKPFLRTFFWVFALIALLVRPVTSQELPWSQGEALKARPSPEVTLARLRDVLKSLETRSSGKNWADTGAWLEGELRRGGEPLAGLGSDPGPDPLSKITEADLVEAGVSVEESPAAKPAPQIPVTVEGLNAREQGPAVATLRRVVMLGRLNSLPESLAKVVPADLAASVKVLGDVDPKALPEELAELARLLDALRGLDGLRLAAEAPAEEPPKVEAIRDDTDRVTVGLKQADLSSRLLPDLSVKSFLDGYPTQARRLLPDQCTPDHAGALLDDMRTVLLGDGRVTTAPAARAVAPDPAAGPGSPRGPPPGALSLIPDAVRGSWKVEVPADAPRSLLSTDEVAGIQRRLKAQVSEQLATKQSAIQALETRTFGEIGALRETVETRITQRAEQIRTIESRLGRALKDYERNLAHDRLGQKGESIAVVTDEIRRDQEKTEKLTREYEEALKDAAIQEKRRAERQRVYEQQQREFWEHMKQIDRDIAVEYERGFGRELDRIMERTRVRAIP